MARELGWDQPRLSKLERGTQHPSEDDLRAWIAATGATDEQAAELRALVADARLGYRVWSDAWKTPESIVASQDEIAATDARATRIAEYQPSMVPGLIQTPAYTREMLSVPGGPVVLGAEGANVEQRVAALQRRQQILYVPGKRIQLVMGEAALYLRFGDRVTLAGQLDRLAATVGLPGVEVGVLPFDVPSPVLPLAGFAVNDSAIVWVETLTGEQCLDTPDEVAAYVAAFDAALHVAVMGEDAAALIHRARGAGA